VVSSGASRAAAWGIAGGASAGFGIQQTQTGEWRSYRAGWRRGETAADSEADEVHRGDRRVAGESERLPAVVAAREWTEIAARDGAKRGNRGGAAVVPVGLVSIAVIQLTAQMRILVAVASIDFRAGIDGLARICRAQLEVDPFCGWLFVFCNRRRTAVKILTYDGQGFWVCHKRLSNGKFPYWPTDGPIQELAAHQLQVLLMGADPQQARGVSAWRPLPRVA
jgi:transposase